MKSATVTELKNQLSKFLRFVKQGETVVVLDRGFPIAELQPRHRKSKNSLERITALEDKGIIRRGDPKRFKKFQFPQESQKSGVLDTLLEERRSGR